MKSTSIDRKNWEIKFTKILKLVHKRNVAIKVKKLMKKISSARNSMIKRSAKYNVECNITIDDLRELTLKKYGTPCKFSGRILIIDNIVFDHIVPISKGGTSNKDNIQIISKFSNNIKGSWMESDFLIVLDWIDKLPENLKRDVSIRLAGGKSYNR